MDTKAYLKRIGYEGSLELTAETLSNLHLAHLLAVPFENLSIHSGEPIVLADDALFEKIVSRRRGGFCYELNGLFAALLRELGFDVMMLSAVVAESEGGFSPEFDHMTLLVTLEARWLVDVGFGDSFQQPLLLDPAEQTQGDFTYRIISEGTRSILMRRRESEEWKPQYRFTLNPYNYADFAERCLFHQTSPESHFMKGRMCTLLTPQGRITLSGTRLITTDARGNRIERTLTTEKDYLAVLRNNFGINVG